MSNDELVIRMPRGMRIAYVVLPLIAWFFAIGAAVAAVSLGRWESLVVAVLLALGGMVIFVSGRRTKIAVDRSAGTVILYTLLRETELPIEDVEAVVSRENQPVALLVPPSSFVALPFASGRDSRDVTRRVAAALDVPIRSDDPSLAGEQR